MKDVRNINIWKEDNKSEQSQNMFLDTDITELNLSVRPFNCLKRANCHTIGDVLDFMGDDGQGLRKIRNLGSKSEEEIREKIQEYKNSYSVSPRNNVLKKTTLIKPKKNIWQCEIEQFHLSNYALSRLKACGVHQVRDLYATNPKNEPGWYAVRELFEKIPSCR